MDFKDDEGFLAEHKSRACKRCGSETHFTKDCTAPRLITCHSSPGGGEWSSVETLVEVLVEESGRRVETLVEVLVEEIGGWVEILVEELGALVQKNIQVTIPVFFDIQIVVEDE